MRFQITFLQKIKGTAFRWIFLITFLYRIWGQSLKSQVWEGAVPEITGMMIPSRSAAPADPGTPSLAPHAIPGSGDGNISRVRFLNIY